MKRDVELIKNLAQFNPLPWVCVGDFNKILTPSEKGGGGV